MVVITNTLILPASDQELSSDEYFHSVTDLVNDLIKTEAVDFIKLPSFHRIIITFRTHQASSKTYSVLRSMGMKPQYSAMDTRVSESVFLQLPDPGKKYVISPPPSPPADWHDRPEDGPNRKIVHDPTELTGLLFQRLSDRIENFDESAKQHQHTDEDFVDEAGKLTVPKVLLEHLKGNPIIILDPPPATAANTDGKNKDGISVNRIKTPRPPI